MCLNIGDQERGNRDKNKGHLFREELRSLMDNIKALIGHRKGRDKGK